MKRKFIFSSLLIVVCFYLPSAVLADDPDIIDPASSEEGPLPTPKDYLSDFPNELIAAQDLNLTFTYHDVVIPGQNGMDIVVTRKYNQSWYLEIPWITTAKASTGAVPVNFECLGDIQSIQVNMNSNNLMSVGYSSSSNIPSNTLAALSNNSILVCEGGFPTIIQDDGQKLVFGVLEDKSSGSFISKKYLLSNKVDRFGNAIAYTYEGDPRTKRLTKITRNDGYIVNLNYETIGLKDVVKSIAYKDKTVNYSYDGSARLIQHEDQENRVTKYSYTPFLSLLASVETHEGLRADYDYYPSDGDALNSGNLRGKTISGPGIKTRQFHHEFPTFFAGKRAIQVEYEVLPGKERTKEFIIEKVSSIPSSYLSGEIILSGKITSKSVFIGNSGPRLPQAYASEDELLLSETNVWDYQISGTYGCRYRFNSALDSHRSCSIPILKSKKLKINNSGFYDEFITDYSQHNEFGAPKAIVGRNNFNAEKRYTSNSFIHDYENWVVNRIKTENLSDDNVNWKTSFEVDYYPWSQDAGFRSQIKQVKEFGVSKSSYTQYHPNGEIKAIVDANNNQYQFNDYYLGIAKSSLLPGVNQAKTIEVNDDGRVQSISDYLNNKTSFTYDNIGRLLKTEYPLESDANFWHDADNLYLKADSDDLTIPGSGIVDGQWKKVTIQGTLQKTRYLDAFSRVTLLQELDLSNSSSARYTRFEYDLDGRVTFVSHPSKYADSLDGVSTTYDDLGRIKQIQTNLGTTNISHLSGNRKRVINPRGFTTTYTYQSFDEASRSQVVKIESPEGVTTEISRDIFSKIKSVTQKGLYQGNTISSSRYYYYDNRQFLCREFNPETGYTAFNYDNVGNLKWKWVGTSVDYCNYSGVIPSEATQYIYDSRGNMTLINNPSGTPDLSFTYDDNSDMKSAIRGNVRWDYFYNSLNQLTQEVLSLDGRTFNIEYGYDALGNESYMTYPSGRKLDFMPNAFGEHTQVNNYVHSALYHATGQLKEFKFGNGKIYSQTLNDSMLPQRITVGGLVDLTYSYDGANNITSITDGIRSVENRTMTYDALDRLQTANGPWGNSTFDYDSLGNLMNKTLGFKSYNYSYDRTKNRLAGITGSKAYTFEYDPHGNVKGNGHFSFAYDKANLLTSVNAGETASYQYDAQKRRVLVTEGLDKTYNVYNKAGKLVHKFSVNANEPSDYIYLNDLQVAKVDGVPGPQAPLSPAYLSIPEYNSGGSFTVNWSSSEDATSYTLQERKGVENWNTVYSGSALSKYLTGRTSESYQYRVKACSLAGCSQYRESAVLGVFNLDDGSIPATIFKAPTTPSSDNDGQFYVDWVAAAGATSYELQQKKDSNSWITVQNSATRTYSANISTSGTYYFRVRSCNNNGCSGYSSTASTLVSILTETPSCPSHEICLDDPLGELR